MSKTNQVILEAFMNGAKKGVGNTLWIDGEDKLYLEGFGVVVYRNPHGQYLINGDRNPSGWGAVQVGVKASRLSPNSPIISFSALRAARLDYKSLTIIEAQQAEDGNCWAGPDKQWKVKPVDREATENLTAIPSGATVYNVVQLPSGNYDAQYHKLGGTLFSYDGRFFVSGFDEGSYFISELPKPVESLAEAYQSLKPPAVLTAEAAHKDVRRQGEWFFVKMSDNRREHIRRAMRTHALPVTNLRSNRHVCELLEWEGNIFVTGKVLHKRYIHWFGGAMFDLDDRKPIPQCLLDQYGETTGQHATLDLGKDLWTAHRSLEVNSWSAQGKVD